MTEEESALLSQMYGQADLHARLFVATLEMAARTHPDLVQEAVWRVFDLTSATEKLQAVRADLQEVIRLGVQARELARAVRQDIDQLEARMDRLAYEGNGKPAAPAATTGRK